MFRLPSLFQTACRAMVLALALACAAAVFAGQGGRWSDRLDVLNHLEPIWLAGAVVALALWILLGREGRITPILAGATVLIALSSIAPEFLAARARSAPAAGHTFKVVQFNLWEHNLDPEGTARWILAQDADVILLEEATHPIVHALRPSYPYRTTCTVRDFCSTMILARVRPAAQGGLALPGASPWIPAAWASYPSPDGEITVVATHMTWPMPAGPQQAQSRALAQLLGRFDKRRLIVGGDFNSTPWSFSLRRQDAMFGLERRTRALFSWPAASFTGFHLVMPFPLIPIDHVYAGSAWKTVSVQRGPRLGSDHYPVVVTLQSAR
jgi:endonuclease/exonuclease/phosphatase (EEP) superfamily protein YafD